MAEHVCSLQARTPLSSTKNIPYSQFTSGKLRKKLVNCEKGVKYTEQEFPDLVC